MSSSSDLTAAMAAASSAATMLINEKAAAELRIVDLTLKVNELTMALDAADQEMVVAKAEMARMQAIIDADTEEPPTPVAMIGATIGSNDGGLNVTADVRRCYNRGGLPSSVDGALRDASARCRSGGVVWTSYKGSLPSDASLRASLKAISDHLWLKLQTGWVTYEHEPDIKGGVAPAVYHAGYDQLERVIDEFDNLFPIVCLTGFSGDKDPNIWETYYRPTHPVIGFDHYNKGHQQTGEPMSTPAENYGLLCAWAKAKGKYVAIGETGVGDDAVSGPVIKTREQWYAEHRKFALDPANGIVAACAFDSGLAILSPSEARSWFAL